MTLVEGASRALTGTVQPSDANQSLIWTSSAEGVAVWEAGKVVAKGVGTAEITATTVNGLTASCKVTVNAATS
ncbi:major capsid protein [Klebsiella phage ChM-G5]|nr:major capsid protein [Klebsiella phage ChM-G5]